ncbi:hypothetical protein QQS21_008282 [Conoideocrella luteorostrata]|uniref:Zn(2)-C6 fungal-type domain-containing protein n=1 Tax=Conoideocrella luteorostrata TaxID=1105319 RepID=A0AAJ0CJ56_9HYPO|nr:hypothetical protein QQS21_008282 [Conoideocrella luteorostrata]
MFPSDPSDSSATRRKHTTTACGPCRESKVKCDGAAPTCTSCETRGKQCHYQAGDDKRRLSHRLVVELLCDRIDQLGRFIRENAHEPPAMDVDKHNLLRKALGHLRLLDAVPSEITVMQPGKSQPEHQHEMALDLNNFVMPDPKALTYQTTTGPIDGLSLVQGTDGSPAGQTGLNNFSDLNDLGAVFNDPPGNLYVNWGWSNDDLNLLTMHKSPRDTSDIPPQESIFDQVETGNIPGSETTGLLQKKNEHVDAEDTEILVSQLADRIGSLRIGPGGQVLYDGVTSNFNLVDMGAPDDFTVHRTVRHDGPIYLEQLNMGKSVPQDLEDHLSNLYFAWQDPAFHVVKRDIFEKAKATWRVEQQDTPYFTEALQNAICSLGAAFEPRHFPTFTSYPKSLADFFADRAKTLLEIELDSPSIATVQTLVILSGHDIGCKRDSRGWLYSGMATRLAFHLAMHLDMTDYVLTNRVTQQEADLRRDVFWAAYTVDHIWSSHLGRTFRVNMECVNLGLPNAEDSVNPVGQWSPYISDRMPSAQNPLPDPTVELHRQRVLLCEIIAPLGFALYGNMNIAPEALHKLNISTVAKLMAWKEALSPSVQVRIDDFETAYLPHVILLHMSFHQNIIYIHRPWMSKGSNTGQAYLNVGHDPEHARVMCLEAAISIGKLLQMYETRYGLRRMHIQAVGITCSAALLLIFAVVINSGDTGDVDATAINGSHSKSLKQTSVQQAALYLSVCFNALDEFGFAWESAKKARHFLDLLQKRWERQVRRVRKGEATIPSKRQRQPQDNDAEPLSQRPWSGMRYGHHQMLNSVDMSADLEWIMMDNDQSPASGLGLTGPGSSSMG